MTRRSKTKDNEYVHFDEREDVLASLELLGLVAPQLKKRPSYWKWMIIGAQSALQGAMVCALADSTGTSVLARNSAVEMLNWLRDNSENRGNPPDERLASFRVLLNKCVSELKLVVTSEQRRDIDRLHEHFRNSFTHFTPKGWSIEKVGLPRIIGAALDAVADLMNMQRPGAWLDEQQIRRLRHSLNAIRASLKIDNQQV